MPFALESSAKWQFRVDFRANTRAGRRGGSHTGKGRRMGASGDIRLVNVDGSSVDAFLEYATEYGPLHDDSYVSRDELAGFDPAFEPAVIAHDAAGAAVGAASVMVNGYETEGLARFRVLHAADPAAYVPMLDALLGRLPARVTRPFVFLPENPGPLRDVLSGAGFVESRRSYVLLHASPATASEPVLPAETTIEHVLSSAGVDWAHVVNAAFHGEPGRYVMTAERARELLAREAIIREGTLLACRAGTPAGVVMTVSEPYAAYCAEIETLAVVPGEQHVGLGRALLHAALRAVGASGCSSAMLSVSATNKRALALYLDAGFKVTDVRVCWERLV